MSTSSTSSWSQPAASAVPVTAGATADIDRWTSGLCSSMNSRSYSAVKVM